MWDLLSVNSCVVVVCVSCFRVLSLTVPSAVSLSPSAGLQSFTYTRTQERMGTIREKKRE